METLGERVIRLREARGWNQSALAKESGIGQSTVAGIEGGSRNKAPSSLIEIAHALGVDAYWLKTGLGKQKPDIQLSADESLLLRALPLISDEMRELWINAAQKAVDRDNEHKAKAA